MKKSKVIDPELGILHESLGFYVSNEGSSKHPNYHVWTPGITHATVDSAFSDFSIAVARCNYLANKKKQRKNDASSHHNHT